MAAATMYGYRNCVTHSRIVCSVTQNHPVVLLGPENIKWKWIF